MLSNNIIALIITFAISLIWLRLNDYAAHKGWISSGTSRKIIHIGTGPIFVLCWIFFNNAFEARFLASLVPFLITTQFLLVGLGVMKDESAVQAMSRTGDRREILRGPLYYGILFVVATLVFWKNSPVGIVALMMVCGGDGFADLIGRRYGMVKIPWNTRKSLWGSVAMFLGGLIFSFVILGIYISAALFIPPLSSYIIPLIVISVTATLVESLPLNDIDNITIAVASILVGFFLF